MLEKERKIMLSYVAKTDDTVEKRTPYQRNSVKWIHRFHNLQRQDAGSHCFITFLIYPGL